MAITVTPDLVNQIHSSGQSDAIIQIKIDYVISRVGACLEGNYGAEYGGYLAALYVANSFYQSSQEVQTERGSFGDSISYATGGNSKNMLLDQLRTEDTAKCFNALIETPFGMFTLGANS